MWRPVAALPYSGSLTGAYCQLQMCGRHLRDVVSCHLSAEIPIEPFADVVFQSVPVGDDRTPVAMHRFLFLPSVSTSPLGRVWGPVYQGGQ